MALLHTPSPARVRQSCVPSAHNNLHLQPQLLPQRSAAPAFQRRRAPRQTAQGITVRAGRIEGKDPWWEKNSAANMRSVTSMDQFINELSQARDKLVVVDFFAKWCGSCKALYPKLCQLSTDNPNMLLLKVEFDSNKQLAKALDVKVLPYFHLYRGAEGRVAAFSASVAKVQRLRDALAEHSTPRCSLGTSPIVSKLSSLLNVQGGQVVPGPAAQERNAQAMPI